MRLDDDNMWAWFIFKFDYEKDMQRHLLNYCFYEIYNVDLIDARKKNPELKGVINYLKEIAKRKPYYYAGGDIFIDIEIDKPTIDHVRNRFLIYKR